MNLRKEAKGHNCTARIPGVCNNDRATVVLCHTNEHRAAGAGMGMKPHDVMAFIACKDCHDLLDGRTFKPDYSYSEYRVMEYQAVIRTLKIWTDEGLLDV